MFTVIARELAGLPDCAHAVTRKREKSMNRRRSLFLFALSILLLAHTSAVPAQVPDGTLKPIPKKTWLKWFKWTAAALVLGAAAIFLWQRYFVKRDEGLASGNGRIEATEIDVAAKIPARIREILVHEGDFVTAGQVVVLMDTDSLNAQRREAEAQHQSAAQSPAAGNQWAPTQRIMKA